MWNHQFSFCNISFEIFHENFLSWFFSGNRGERWGVRDERWEGWELRSEGREMRRDAYRHLPVQPFFLSISFHIAWLLIDTDHINNFNFQSSILKSLRIQGFQVFHLNSNVRRKMSCIGRDAETVLRLSVGTAHPRLSNLDTFSVG